MFIFGETIAEAIEAIPEEHQLRFYRYVKDYGLHRIEPELSGFELSTWIQMKNMIDNTRPKSHAQGTGKPGAPYGNTNRTKSIQNDSFNLEQLNALKNNSFNSEQLKSIKNNSGNINENINDNVNKKKNENTGVQRAPEEGSFSQNPNSGFFLECYEALRKDWNDLRVGAPYTWLIANLPPAEASDITRFISNEAEPVKTGVQAMRNFRKILDAPAEYDPGGHKGYSFVSFLIKGVQHFRDEAEPLVRFRIKHQYGTSPPTNLAGKKSLGGLEA